VSVPAWELDGLDGRHFDVSLTLTSASCEKHPSTLIADMLSKTELALGVTYVVLLFYI
jgi:hypothetical protein